MGSIIKMFKATFLTISLVLALAAVISAEDNVPLIKTAMEVLARATSSSQVLSFNLTGVIILIVLKIAVIAYSMLQGGVTGRSSLYSPPRWAVSPLQREVHQGGGVSQGRQHYGTAGRGLLTVQLVDFSRILTSINKHFY